MSLQSAVICVICGLHFVRPPQRTLAPVAAGEDAAVHGQDLAVMKSAAAEQRKTAAPTSSCGSPKRPAGVGLRIH